MRQHLALAQIFYMAKDTQLRDQKLGMITDWLQSGLSQKEFCKNHNIAYHIFHYWYKRYREQSRQKPGQFIPLQVNDTGSNKFMELHFVNGNRIIFYQIVSSDYLKSLL